MFIIDSRDMIFIPMFVWKISPEEHKLSNIDEWKEMRLTKTEKVIHDCNGNQKYIFGDANHVIVYIRDGYLIVICVINLIALKL